MLMKDLPIGTKFYFVFDGSPKYYYYERTGQFTIKDLYTNKEYPVSETGCYISEVVVLDEVQ